MTTKTKQKPSEETILAALANSEGNASAAARELGIPERTFRRWVKDSNLAEEVKKSKAKQDGEEIEIKKTKRTKGETFDGSIDSKVLKYKEADIMKLYGLNPNEYQSVAFNVNERDGGTAAAPRIVRTTSLALKPKVNGLIPAFDGKPVVLKWNKNYKKAGKRLSELVLIVGDYHAPYHDVGLHKKVLALIEKYKPSRIIINGDLVDFPTVGRHRKVTNICTAEANECIQAGGRILADIRLAAGPDCQIDFIPGNHDAWLNNYMIDNAEAAYGICQYGEDQPALDLSFLLKFKDFNINMIGDPSLWQESYIYLTDELTVFHGGPIDSKAGGSALKAMLDGQEAYISNHIHRSAIINKTVWKQGKKKILEGGEAGCMCQVKETTDGFPTYMTRPNWQQGCMTAEVYPDGRYSLELASYQNGVLLYRGEQL